MTFFKAFLAAVLVCGSLAAQGTRYNFITLPVPPVTEGGSVRVVGEPGSTTAYYWVVAKYTGGNATPYGPIIVTTLPPLQRLGVFQYAVISWSAVAGVTGYDVLRTSTIASPTGACNCAVALNTSSTTVNDQSQTLQAYTVNSSTVAYSFIQVNNRDYVSPTLTMSVNGGPETTIGGDSLTFSAPLNRAVNNITLSLASGGFLSTTGGLGLTQCPNGNTLVNTGGTTWGCWGNPGTVTNVTGMANEITVANGGTTPALSLAPTFDISSKTSTKPVKTGTSLPATCGVGELYYKTDATAGQNLYSCTATNTWTQHTGSTAVENNGTAVGTRGINNYLPGTGITTTLADTGTKITIQNAIDTAVVMTRANAQSGADFKCSGSGTAGAQTCSMSPTLTAYTTGMVLRYIPGNTNTTTQTINVDSLGVKSILKHDGTALAAGDLTASRQYSIWYDGTAFRLPPVGSVTASATRDHYIDIQTGVTKRGINEFSTWGTPSTNAATLDAYGANQQYTRWGFSNTADQNIATRVMLPITWSSTDAVSMRLAIGGDVNSDGVGNVEMKVDTACPSNYYNEPTWNTAASAIITQPGSLLRAYMVVSSIPMTGCSAGDILLIRLSRNTATASNAAFPAYMLNSTLQMKVTN